MLRQIETQVFDDANMSSLAERLKEARDDKKWSKAELLRAAKLKSPSTLTELENGKRTESPQLPSIAAALDVEVLWLQHGIGPKKRAFQVLKADDVAAMTTEQLRKELSARLAAEHEKMIEHHIHMLNHEIWELREPLQATGTTDQRRSDPGKK